MPKKVRLRQLPGVNIDHRHCRELRCHVVTGVTQLENLVNGEVRVRVDFSREFVVIVCRGECPTGGYTVTIHSGRAEARVLRLKVEFTDPSPDALVTLAMTYPAAAVAVPRKPFNGVPDRVVLSEQGARGAVAETEV